METFLLELRKASSAVATAKESKRSELVYDAGGTRGGHYQELFESAMVTDSGSSEAFLAQS
jgi:hypothetical protein